MYDNICQIKMTKMQYMSERARCKRLEGLLNLLIPIIHPFYLTHNTIHLEVVPHMPLTSCYFIYNMHATCIHVLEVFRFSGKRQQNTN